jgi:hypothetical protein
MIESMDKATQTAPWPDVWEEGQEALPQALLTVLPGPLRRLSRLPGGRNSAVFLAECGEMGRCVVKHYASPGPSGLDRLSVESDAFRFLETACPDHDPSPTPRVLGQDMAARLAVYEYKPGAAVTEPEDRDVDAALAFVARLRALGTHPKARSLPLAAEASFCLEDLRDTLTRRFKLLATVAKDSPEARSMRHFLDTTLRPLAEGALDLAGTALPLPPEKRTLSPSDFGFHNALRTPDGGLVFLDFEYFGWDDPAKLGVDFLLHPAMMLPRELRHRFAKGLCAIFGPALATRLSALGPVYGVKWCLILLNEFTAQGLARRRLSGTREERAAILTTQLAKAEAMAQGAKQNVVAADLEP